MTTILTTRLLLRELNADDAIFILELLNEADFLRFIGDKGVRSLEDARDYIRRGPMDSYARNGFGLYACLSEGEPVGICGLVKRDGLDQPDLGFAFLERHRSHGYALEAALAILERGRTHHKLSRILAITTRDNARSIALLEKAGFGFERIIRFGEDSDALNLFSSTMDANL